MQKFKKFKVLHVNNQYDKRLLPEWCNLGETVAILVTYDARLKRETYTMSENWDTPYNPINNDYCHFLDENVFNRYFKLVN